MLSENSLYAEVVLDVSIESVFHSRDASLGVREQMA